MLIYGLQTANRYMEEDDQGQFFECQYNFGKRTATLWTSDLPDVFIDCEVEPLIGDEMSCHVKRITYEQPLCKV